MAKLIISLFFLQLAFALTTATERKHTDVIVEGMVYCQNCKTRGIWSLTGAKPIANATISVGCKDRRNRVIYYKAFSTNQNGYFYAQLVGLKVKNPFMDHPLQVCKVKLVSSPNKACNVLTNVNYGLSGAPLIYQDERVVGPSYRGVVFAAGPLAFRPGFCPPKATHIPPRQE